jgi:DNA primase catalytic subunit
MSEPLLSQSQIEAYYERNTIDLSVVPRVNFRHFRFRLADGMFFKVKRRIRNLEDLREQLVNTVPFDVFYSTACWLNPHQLGSKVGKEILKNIMISCDLVFDIDVDAEVESLEDARKQAVMLYGYLRSRKIDVRYLAFSGSKGFHVVCNDPWGSVINEENPAKREMKAIEKRKEMVKEVKSKGILFDGKVTVDTRRIIRLPGTINSKTGLTCTVLSSREISKLDAGKILKVALKHSISTPRILRSARKMTRHFMSSKSLGDVGRLGVRPIPKNELYFSTFITNNIPKTRLKIPVLEFGSWKSVEEVASIVRRVQRHYGLGDTFLFYDGSKFSAFSLKAVSRRRVEKILFAAGSLNLNACKKYGCTFIRVGRSIGLGGQVVRQEPTFVRVFESSLRGQASRPHFEFLTSMGLRMRAEGMRFCGPSQERLELLHVIME